MSHWVRTTAPGAGEPGTGVVVGHTWVDISGAPVLKKCTSTSPFTWVSVEGASSGPQAHASSHKLGGSDLIRLDEFALPTASVNFNGQQATNFRVENLTTDPVSPTVGQAWLRTDL